MVKQITTTWENKSCSNKDDLTAINQRCKSQSIKEGEGHL
jgi:hypothetical protein